MLQLRFAMHAWPGQGSEWLLGHVMDVVPLQKECKTQ
jgi:hypothetical protein